MSLQNKHIGFIGGGNMAEALLSGLINSGQGRPSQIAVAEPDVTRRRNLKKRFKVSVLSNNKELLHKSDVVVLAVKPQVMSSVLDEISSDVTKKHLIISIAAGIDVPFIQRYLGKSVRLIRAMPNTPALVGRGITGLYPCRTARNPDKKIACKLFDSVGTTLLFSKEAELDWVTAVSGSGPAYIFLFLEAFIDAAVSGGLSREKARKLVLDTASGATALASEQNSDLKILRQRVTSKGGTTKAALKVLKKKQWPQALQMAVRAAAKRAKELRKG